MSRSESLKAAQDKYWAKLKSVTVRFSPAEYRIYDKLLDIAERESKSMGAVIKDLIRES